MQRSIIRFFFPAMLLAAACGAAVWTWTLAQHVVRVEQAGAQTSLQIDRLQTLLDEVADQDLIHVGWGRLDKTTIEQISGVLQRITSGTSSLLAQSLAGDAAAGYAVATASAAIAEIDGRARENARVGLDLMAADLLLTETHQSRRALQQDLRALRTAEAAAVAAARSTDVKRGWAALAVLALLCAWALIRWSRAPAVAAAAEAPAVEFPDSIRTSAGEAPQPPSGWPADLVAVADLCTAIGRTTREAELEGLLERAGTLLGASGIVIWMAAGEELFAAAVHGYDLRRLSQLGPIGSGSANATAEAWRSSQLQTVTGDATSRGAVVAPMLGQDRCIGVLAVEVAAGREADTATQAVATLIAAQLAAILTAWPAGSSVPPADVLPFERAAGGAT